MYFCAFGTNTLQACSDNKNAYIHTLQIGRPHGSLVIRNGAGDLVAVGGNCDALGGYTMN